MSPNQPKKIDLGHTELILLPDDIVQVNATDQTYTISDIKEIHKAIDTLMENQKALVLLVGSNHTLIDSEARNFLSTAESSAQSKANAYIIKSLAQRLIINFLIKVSGTHVPTQIFTEKESAIKWLKTHK